MSATTEKAARDTRVVIDTNVLISGLLFGGKPRLIIDVVNADGIGIVISEPLISELEEVLLTKFKITFSHWQAIEANLRSSCSLVPTTDYTHILIDEPDNRLLEAAEAGQCDYIITGDKLLLALGNYQKTKIISVAQFLELYPAKEK